MGKSPREMSESEFVEEFDVLEERTRVAESRVMREHGSAPSEVSWHKGKPPVWVKDWETYSRSRGFTEDEITDLRRFLELATGEGFDYTISDPRWIWWQHQVGPQDPWKDGVPESIKSTSLI